jgi:hypothetical protein
MLVLVQKEEVIIIVSEEEEKRKLIRGNSGRYLYFSKYNYT